MNTPVKFELAKLLREEGFTFSQKETYYNPVNGCTNFEEITPTIAEVVMWLYETHGVWISVTKDTDIKWSNDYFNYHILSPNGTTQSDIGGTQPNTPTEAYEAAIEYTLKNLI